MITGGPNDRIRYATGPVRNRSEITPPNALSARHPGHFPAIPQAQQPDLRRQQLPSAPMTFPGPTVARITAAANPTGAQVQIPRSTSSNARGRGAGRSTGGAQQRGTRREFQLHPREREIWQELTRAYDPQQPRVKTAEFGSQTPMPGMIDQVFGKHYGLSDRCHGGACVHLHHLYGNGCPRGPACPLKHGWWTTAGMRYILDNPNAKSSERAREYMLRSFTIWLNHWRAGHVPDREDPLPWDPPTSRRVNQGGGRTGRASTPGQVSHEVDEDEEPIHQLSIDALREAPPARPQNLEEALSSSRDVSGLAQRQTNAQPTPGSIPVSLGSFGTRAAMWEAASDVQDPRDRERARQEHTEQEDRIASGSIPRPFVTENVLLRETRDGVPVRESLVVESYAVEDSTVDGRPTVVPSTQEDSVEGGAGGGGGMGAPAPEDFVDPEEYDPEDSTSDLEDGDDSLHGVGEDDGGYGDESAGVVQPQAQW
jgi:hypothetical protein